MADEHVKFLGLGTVVEVDDMDALKDTKYVVMARAIGQDSKGETILRYMLAPHPHGDVPDQKDNILRITASQIKQVIYEGYTDELDEQLLDDLENTMRGALAQVKSKAKAESNGQNNSDEPVKQTVPLVKQETKNVVENQDLKEKELLKKDPFYKFRKMKEENANGRSD